MEQRFLEVVAPSEEEARKKLGDIKAEKSALNPLSRENTENLVPRFVFIAKSSDLPKDLPAGVTDITDT